MTQKELLYLEDATGHETSIISILEEKLEYAKDENIVSFLNEEIQKHNTIKEKLLNLLEEKSNE